jgi:uncharacterized membrane protein
MRSAIRYRSIFLALLLCALAGASAAETGPASATTYSITVREDGTALWQLEYRTPLVSDSDLMAFENYTRDLPSVYLPQVQDLMQHSAAQAAVAASRPMAISNVTGTAVVQTTPTGRYGVVLYSFGWSGFAQPGDSLVIGDAFAGGLYLAKDHALIIRYPAGWHVARAEPAPDQQRDGLIWYGLRSFSPGEPRVVLEKSAFPLVPVTAIIVLLILAGAALIGYRRKSRRDGSGQESGEGGSEPKEQEEPAGTLSDAEQAGLEERIRTLLADAGGELYQSEIVKTLGIPKSTVSAALNALHRKGCIRKIKKGRENLIRLVQDRV